MILADERSSGCVGRPGTRHRTRSGFGNAKTDALIEFFSAHSSNPSRRIGVSHLPSYAPTSEPNVGRRPLASFHVLTFLLAALLAWPWNVILSAAEAFQVSNLARSSMVHPPA